MARTKKRAAFHIPQKHVKRLKQIVETTGKRSLSALLDEIVEQGDDSRVEPVVKKNITLKVEHYDKLKNYANRGFSGSTSLALNDFIKRFLSSKTA